MIDTQITTSLENAWLALITVPNANARLFGVLESFVPNVTKVTT